MTNNQILERQLKELKLTHIARNIKQLLLDQVTVDMTNLDFLSKILSFELEQRHIFSVQKKLITARFPLFDKSLSLEGFNFGIRRGVNKRQIKELSGNMSWIDNAYNIVLLGPTGIGKSFLACYLGLKAIESGYSVLFVTMEELMRLLNTENLLTHSRSRMKMIRTCDLLILDEIDNIPADNQAVSRFIELIYGFYQQKSVIFTSNKEFGKWPLFGDEDRSSAILDRLLHHSEVFSIDGDSWRTTNHQSILGNLFKGEKEC